MIAQDHWPQVKTIRNKLREIENLVQLNIDKQLRDSVFP